jgi:hypothetical protein
MKTFNEIILEGKKFKTKEEFLTYSKKYWVSNDSLDRILRGEDSYAYHGTNRDFNKFDMSFLRQWRADEFLGNGIFLTPDKNIAEKYADANANSELPITLLDDAKKIDKDLAEFMQNLYYKGNSTWSDPKIIDMMDKWDLNDIAELVNLIPNSQSEKDYRKNNVDNNSNFVNFFSTSHSALSIHQIKDLEKFGFGNYYPKIYTVYIKGTNSILLSNSISEIKKSKHDIIIAYNVENLIDDVPEIIIKNVDLLIVLKKEILNYWD